jgi:hypothetical protein
MEVTKPADSARSSSTQAARIASSNPDSNNPAEDSSCRVTGRTVE